MVTRLSQGHLNMLQVCPRKFQHLYLDQLASPMSPAQQERLLWGEQFHLLMQQRELALPTEKLIELEHPLQRCAQALMEAAPAVFQTDGASLRLSEHRRTLELQAYLLTVVYDLLLLAPHQAHILDWKTYPQPQQPEALQRDWQTRLYPFVLAETTDYAPDQIAMTYWFVRAGSTEANSPQPQQIRFTYSADLHEQTRQDLTLTLELLTAQTEAYRAGQELPQVDEAAGYCATCSFALRCQRGPDLMRPQQAPIPDLAAIEEVVL